MAPITFSCVAKSQLYFFRRKPVCRSNVNDTAFDVIVIGAGVVGCAMARRFTLEGARVLVVEKSEDILDGASKGNSGMVVARAGTHCVHGVAAFDTANAPPSGRPPSSRAKKKAARAAAATG